MKWGEMNWVVGIEGMGKRGGIGIKRRQNFAAYKNSKGLRKFATLAKIRPSTY